MEIELRMESMRKKLRHEEAEDNARQMTTSQSHPLKTMIRVFIGEEGADVEGRGIETAHKFKQVPEGRGGR